MSGRVANSNEPKGSIGGVCGTLLYGSNAANLTELDRECFDGPISDFAGKTVRDGCLVDVKSKLDPEAVRQHGLRVWRL